MSKICMVMPEISHIENNDISMSIYNFANVLKQIGNKVTILYTSTNNDFILDYWKRKFTEIGVGFEFLINTDLNIYLSAADLFFRNSYAVYKKLEDRSFDYIYFVDFYAAGFHTIQAKKTTSKFKKTILSVIMLGSYEYILECKELESNNPVFDMRLQYGERYCCQNADIIIDNTNFILEWARRKNWELAKKQYVLSLSDSFIKSPVKIKNRKSIIYWGNHDDYNRINTFCRAIINMKGLKLKYNISFIFSSPVSNLDKTADYISRIINDSNMEYSIYNYYDISEAITNIKVKKGIIVFMSATGDYQYKIAECVKNGVPFLAEAVGGINNLVDSQLLFEPNIFSLENRIRTLDKAIISYQYSDNNLKKFLSSLTESVSDILDKVPVLYPKVSVCIAYYNHGKYLPMLLKSLEKNTYTNFEVIIVDDGSTDNYSVSVFKEMTKMYQSEKYIFYSKENEFIGKTRNFAVDKASGEYIIFADSDDIAAPDMIEKYVTGIMKSGCDCLSAYMHYFNGELELEQSIVAEGIYSPTGPILELAMFENCIGGINLIIKKDTFINSGGFSTERLCYEDWRFLIKLAIKGYRLDVIPLCLYYYRILPNSMIRSKNEYKSKNWLISAYYEEMPKYLGYLIRDFCIPSWSMWKDKFFRKE